MKTSPDIRTRTFGNMSINLALVVIVVLVPGAMTWYATADLVQTLNRVAWMWVIYMLLRVVQTLLATPVPRVFVPPDPKLMKIPVQITRDTVNQMSLRDQDGVPGRVILLLGSVLGKIKNAADEGAIYQFLEAQTEQEALRTHARYGVADRLTDILGYEGLMGTIIGMMVFMVQAAKFFDFSAASDSSSEAMTALVLESLKAIDLITVMTALITSLIGWGMKAGWGGVVETLRDREMTGLVEVKGWILDHIMAKVFLPSHTQTYLELREIPQLAEPLVRAAETLERTLGEATAHLNHAVKELRTETGARIDANRIEAAASILMRDALEELSGRARDFARVQFVVRAMPEVGRIRYEVTTNGVDGGEE